ncbi:MAG: hypothetical protein FD139_1491 [Methylocystaceae bacterium]|nr:MAG: hypothetical protein FD139_1491 [Methylocystaceae bacterium]
MRSETSSAFSLTRRRAHSLFRFRRGRCSRLSRAAASTGFRASFMAPPLSGLADMRPSPVIAAIRFRGERTSGYREWTAIVLARGKNIENRLAQLFSEPLGARFGDRRRRAARCERIVRTGQAGDANAAHSSALRPGAAKAENPLASTGAGAAAPRNATSNGRIADAEREARSTNSAAAWRRCAFAAASAACGRYKPAPTDSSPRAAREDAGLRRGMGQDEARVERRFADVA